MKRLLVVGGVVIVIIILAGAIIFWPLKATAPHEGDTQPISSPLTSDANTTTAPESASLTAEEEASSVKLVPPIAEFTSRITKKSFGTHVTPQDSPVSPEKFSGYHTGVDVEYGDVTSDVPVQAIASGRVVTSRTASGYGGVVAIEHDINDTKIVAVYGHLDPASLVGNGVEVAAGQQIGILGEGFTPETDGERKHLHFAVRADATVSLLGYVPAKADLSAWLDPMQFISNAN